MYKHTICRKPNYSTKTFKTSIDNKSLFLYPKNSLNSKSYNILTRERFVLCQPNFKKNFSAKAASGETSINFDDARIAFQSKSNIELLRSFVVFWLCSIKPLVQNSEKIISISKRTFGERFTHYMLKKSFFGHFCAGESQEDMTPVVLSLKKRGIGAIFDYAAESDVAVEDKRIEDRQGVISARVYDYTGEEECDKNLRIMLQCLDSASSHFDRPFAAIKLTALGKPELLEKMSTSIVAIKDMWKTYFGNDTQQVDINQFQEALLKMKVQLPEDELAVLFNQFTKDGFIDYIEWTQTLKLEDLSTRKTDTSEDLHSKKALTRVGLLPLLTETETILMDNMIARIKTIADHAHKKNVRLLIDAEQTYLQSAIDHFTLMLQHEYNKERPTIFNTYQCYLKYSKQRIVNDLERSKREGFYFAGKLVRGAYMVGERARALEKGYESPILDSIDETHKNYNECVEIVLDNIGRSSVMIASHNQQSVEITVNKMNEKGIDRKSEKVYFGQLLGMSDNISYTLGAFGYQVFKYVPYGPVGEVIPYLIRRAQENSNVLGNAPKERKMIWEELKRRLFSKN